CLGAARLRTVDVVERTGVDHQGRTVMRHGVAHGIEPRNIERRMAERHQLMRGQRTRKASPELARGAGDEYLHARSPLAIWASCRIPWGEFHVSPILAQSFGGLYRQ